MPVWAIKWLLILAVMLWPYLALSQAAGEVSHTISFPELNQQYIHVRSEFPVAGMTATVRMANWTPGSYLIRDFSANVDRISFSNDAGQALVYSKSAKNQWQVMLSGTTSLVVEYDVHAGDLSVNTSWASPDFVLINGASVFLYTDVSRDLPQQVNVQAPKALDTVVSPLPGSGTARWRAAGFDELVDSPIVLSNDMVRRFVDGEHEYALVNVGESELWNGLRAAQDLQAIVSATNRFWGVVPFDRTFWFFNLLVERGGGLEHDHGTVIMGSRWQMLNREDYIKWLSLAAHEYFHSWNIRRLRPAALARYDYEKEQYSEALWLAEGITSYYDNLMLSRSGLVEPSEYFKRLAIDLHALELTPGRKQISLDQASRDSWIRHYKPDANSVNSTVSYYTKGAVLGLVLDTRIRAASDNDNSLDDVMRLMFKRWSETPYPDNAFLDSVAEIAGQEIRDWLQPLLETTTELGVDEALAYYGLVLDRHPVNNAARAIGQPVIAGIGVNWDLEQNGLIVKNVIAGMSGSESGLLPGDELLAINEERVTQDKFDDRMTRLQPGMLVSLTIARRDRLMTLPLTLDEARPATYEIKLNPEFGKTEIRRLESWLGQPLQDPTD